MGTGVKYCPFSMKSSEWCTYIVLSLWTYLTNVTMPVLTLTMCPLFLNNNTTKPTRVRLLIFPVSVSEVWTIQPVVIPVQPNPIFVVACSCLSTPRTRSDMHWMVVHSGLTSPLSGKDHSRRTGILPASWFHQHQVEYTLFLLHYMVFGIPIKLICNSNINLLLVCIF